jgi:hypothetical protein
MRRTARRRCQRGMEEHVPCHRGSGQAQLAVGPSDTTISDSQPGGSRVHLRGQRERPEHAEPLPTKRDARKSGSVGPPRSGGPRCLPLSTSLGDRGRHRTSRRHRLHARSDHRRIVRIGGEEVRREPAPARLHGRIGCRKGRTGRRRLGLGKDRGPITTKDERLPEKPERDARDGSSEGGERGREVAHDQVPWRSLSHAVFPTPPLWRAACNSWWPNELRCGENGGNVESSPRARRGGLNRDESRQPRRGSRQRDRA